MYELSHDLAGALSPVIVMLAMMMMTGGSGGSSSYAFSGKADDVGFLLLKARAAARKIPCAHRRSGNGIVLNGGPPISYAEFFDLSARPNDISEAIWQDMSETAFDTIISFIHDPKHQRLVKGCDRDGGKLLEKLRGIGGSKRQQMQTLDDKISAQQLVQLSSYPDFRDDMKDLFQERNNIHGLAEDEKLKPTKMLQIFGDKLLTVFPTVHAQYVLDAESA